MKVWVEDWVYWLKMRSFFRVAQRTFVALMPVFLIGSIAQALYSGFINYDSWFYNITEAYNFVPYWLTDNLIYLLKAIRYAAFNLAGLFIAYMAAEYTARLFKKDAQLAGITSILTLLMISFNGNRPGQTLALPFSGFLLNVNMALVSFGLGYCIGLLFRWLGPDYHHRRFEHLTDLDQRVWNSFKPMLVSLALGIVIALGLYILKVKLSQSWFTSMLGTLFGTNNVLKGVGLAIAVTVLALVGVGYPLQALNGDNNSAEAVANMNYALVHGSSWNIPYKYLGSEIYTAYANALGYVTLALIIAVLLLAQNTRRRHLAELTLFPTMFDSPSGFFSGYPVLFNPIMIVAYIEVVVINMLLTAGLLWLRWIPPVAFAILEGTPDPLAPFVATNGNLNSLIYTIVLLIIDVLCFLPWVRFDMKIERRVRDNEEA